MILRIRFALALGFTIPFAATLAAQTAAPESADGPQALKSITADDLKGHATKLASKEFEGRMTATPGQIKAAESFAKHFEKLGLKPLGDKKGGRRTFFQKWPIDKETFHAKKTGLFSGSKQLTKRCAVFLPRSLRRKSKVALKGKLVFAGRGEVTEGGLKGAIAVVQFVSRGQERGGEGNRLLAKMRGLARDAREAGAKAIVLIAERLPHAFLSTVNYGAAYPHKPRVVMAGKRNRFSIDSPRIPVLVCGGEDAAAVLGGLGLKPSVAYDPGFDLAVGKKSKRAFVLKSEHKETEDDALNVVAYLEGSDPKLKAEALVYSCHMDHLGLALDGQVFHGADDNASGCATVFEISEAYAKLAPAERPKRSVVFLVVSGEELGLYGSEYFSENPTWRLSKIVANINMDMLGRSTAKIPSDTVAITPTYKHTQYSTLAREAARLGKQFGLSMGDADWLYQRSDHYNFAKKGVPVLFFTDDEHPDYHKLTDTADKLEYEKIEKIARLAFLVGYRAANAKGRPKRLGRQNDWF